MLALTVAMLVVTGRAANAAGARPADAQQLVELLNEERAERGLQPLTFHEELTQIATDHSGEMAATANGDGACNDGGGLVHRNPVEEGVDAPWATLSENVAYNCPADVAGIHRQLMNSSDHRDNILDPAMRYVGVGAYRDVDGGLWVTQIFMDLQDGAPAPEGASDGDTAGSPAPDPNGSAPTGGTPDRAGDADAELDELPRRPDASSLEDLRRLGDGWPLEQASPTDAAPTGDGGATGGAGSPEGGSQPEDGPATEPPVPADLAGGAATSPPDGALPGGGVPDVRRALEGLGLPDDAELGDSPMGSLPAGLEPVDSALSRTPVTVLLEPLLNG